MSGYDLNRFIGLTQIQSEEMLCPICLAILCRPVDTDCGHTFCGECLNQWLNAYDNTCPQCRHYLYSNNQMIRQSTKRFQNLINSLQIKCDFADKGCEEHMPLGRLSAHLKECQFNEYKDLVKSMEWIEMNGRDEPFEPKESAVIGGHDLNGEPLYIGRAKHMNDLICGKIVGSHKCCYVAYNGLEHSYQDFEILINANKHSLEWVRGSNGWVPSGAIEGGKQSNGEVLYIGRVNHLQTLTVGKVHPSHRVVYIPFAGQELNYNYYEILCYKSQSF